MTDSASVHVEVDTDACVGSGTCAMIDPLHFQLIDGKAVVTAGEPLTLTDELDDALLSCPVEALRSTVAS
ncbi:ferredoxin [Nocardioides massiliensis]|uniref:Ferredoxin n=1 Tax=Nocardioides massiliensis TaxID=1325935 RepID=A0ABT9NNF2_9ACTN|nr:ferredoxin [Nocardioides massiliensis]MDP9821913.1 ferredoxin [Nocardioides massiliensis]